MPSCCPCLVDGRHNLLSLRTLPQPLTRRLNSHVLLKGKSRVSCDFFKIVTCELSLCHVKVATLFRSRCVVYRIQLRKRRRWATQPALTANAPRSPCEGLAKLLQTLSTSPQNLNSGLNSHGYVTVKLSLCHVKVATLFPSRS